MPNADGSMGTLQMTPEMNFAQIAAGRGHACLRTTTGAVFCWGRNASGQSLGALADGRAALQSGPTDVAEISLAGDVSVARKNDGTVWVWGAPVGGPDAVPLSRRATPTQVPLPGPAVQVAAGPLHICARLMDNRVVCWGQGDVVRSPTPRVMGSEAVRAVGVGLQNACVVRNTDSAVLCWGSGDEGMMLPSGDGARAENPTTMPLFLSRARRGPPETRRRRATPTARDVHARSPPRARRGGPRPPSRDPRDGPGRVGPGPVHHRDVADRVEDLRRPQSRRQLGAQRAVEGDLRAPVAPGQRAGDAAVGPHVHEHGRVGVERVGRHVGEEVSDVRHPPKRVPDQSRSPRGRRRSRRAHRRRQGRSRGRTRPAPAAGRCRRGARCRRRHRRGSACARRASCDGAAVPW
ncbi:MAG: hypothetical protein U0325_01850 [Polyangiales bacterium]